MTPAKARTWTVQSEVQRADHLATMASLLTMEAVLSSLIINGYSCKRTILFTTAFKKLCLNSQLNKPSIYSSP